MKIIPYGRQSLSEADIQSVVKVLRSDWLTQGPNVELFEKAVADYCGAKFAVAVSSGTAALHLAALVANFHSGDEVITSPITFVATPNSIVYSGAMPVFADINLRTYCLDPAEVKHRLTFKTKGIIPVHFAGQPCDMKAIHSIAVENRLTIIEDAAHAIGADYKVNGKSYKVGSCSHSDMTIFSFHPVKQITTGEGGVITTNKEEYYQKLKSLRSHGVTRDPGKLTRQEGPWYYEQQGLGLNYRITDFQCALGISQLKRLDEFIRRRRKIVHKYNETFSKYEELLVPFELHGVRSSWHLYVLQFKNHDRLQVFNALQEKGLKANVHYIPVHYQPYYADRYGYNKGDYPIAETYYDRAITLPLYPAMQDTDVEYVIKSVKETLAAMEK
jgi:UDP-4-amino-4,6-dideoxy-N-acetyl-beta-L-altrosamine transaminase